jgi:hypothetical protein
MLFQVLVYLHIHLFRRLLNLSLSLTTQIKLNVTKFLFVLFSIPNIILHRRVPSSLQVLLMQRISLILISIVYTSFNNFPSSIPIRKFTFVKGSSRCQSQEYWADYVKLVMNVSRMIQIFSRKRAL